MRHEHENHAGPRAGACVIALGAVAAAPGMAAETRRDNSSTSPIRSRTSTRRWTTSLPMAGGQGAASFSRAPTVGTATRRRSSLPGRDSAMYALAPQGDFAPSDEWTLDKEATVVTGADPFSGALQSLQLEKGAEAASPAMCVEPRQPDHPLLRARRRRQRQVQPQGRRAVRGLRRARQALDGREAAARR